MAVNQKRLDKYLADLNFGTRSEVKEIIRKGRVSVNGQPEKKPECKIEIEQDCVCVDGQELVYRSFEYLMFHKPGACLSATKDGKERTVLDYIREEDCPRKKDLFPVGRLDKDTEGLLLLTNDGPLAHRLLSPKWHVEKKYYVKLKHVVSQEVKQQLEQGIDIGDDTNTLPSRVEILHGGREVYISIIEGRYHQIKRMFQKCGNEVLYLKRLSMGSLYLDESLQPGEYRRLTEEEMQLLQG